MLVTTTMTVEGYRVVEYKGLVQGLIVRSPTILQGFFSRIKSIFGGRIGSLAAMCEQGRHQAYRLMVDRATKMGANAILAMRYDASEVASRFSAAEVLCYGTAVVIEKI
jgi:uncharacterized protein YbjQ (UPF0145 family)